MPVIPIRFRYSLLAIALAATPAFAQTTSNGDTARVPSHAPLGSALGAFAAQHGVALSFDPALTQGRQAPAVDPALGIDAGFSALLQGTGLRAVRRADGSYTVQGGSNGTRQTAPLRVRGGEGKVALPQALPYGQGVTLDADALDAQVKGNGDIATALRSNPAVQFSDTNRSSRNMGEIRPDDFSINGAPYYQNLFLLDGATINNDLDPADTPDNGNPAHNFDVPGGAQGIAVDVDLLESLTVYDANVPASFGHFLGGVVDARSRSASDGLHGKVWFRMARSAWDSIITNDVQLNEFAESDTYKYQPEYDKYRIGARLEGRTRGGLGVIGTVTRTRSEIPLRAYSAGRETTGADVNTRTQTRENTSASVALDWTNGEGLQLGANLSYAPTDDVYFISNTRDSYFSIKSGGPTASLRANWTTGAWTLRNTLNYSEVETTRRSDLDYMRNWTRSEAFDWGVSTISGEGSWGNVDQHDRRIGYRFVADRDALQVGSSEHTLQFGAGVQRRDGDYQRLNDHRVLQSTAVTSSCTLSDGSIDDFSCSLSPLYNGAAGQYFKTMLLFHAGQFKVSGEEYEAWVQDDIRIGNWNIRPGLRLDRNNVWQQSNVSPRLAVSWDMLGDQRTVINAGVNRYYGRSFYSYLLRDGRERLRETLTRSSSSTRWEDATSSWNVATNRLSDVDSPYTDEWTLGVDQQAFGLQFHLKYVDRSSRKDILRRKVDDPDRTLYNLNTYEYTNEGRSDSQTWTFSVSPQRPWEFAGTRNSFQLSADHTEVKRNYNSYQDSPDLFELVRLDGKLMYRYELPAAQFLRPWSARLSTRTEIPAWGLSWSNFFRYRAGFEGFTTGTSQTIDGISATNLTSRHFSGSWTWDANLEYRLALPREQEAYARIEVQNVLNRSNLTTASGTAATTMYYEPGRSFWLELGYSF